MLLAELREKYEDNEPIYLEDAMKALGVTSSYCRILMSKWVKNNQLKRFAIRHQSCLEKLHLIPRRL